jgi:EAL domain-containing protein (putative c-di-GMP-specific phosphodiesterase class I)/FixJ family two-component response regulator
MDKPSDINILVLDDDPFILKVIGHMLSGIGYPNVTFHVSGEDALVMLNQPETVPDVILLDINMPKMDGIEFIRHLAEKMYSGYLILLTGEDELMVRASEKLAASYNQILIGRLNKPPKPVVLAKLLEKCLQDNSIKSIDNKPRVKTYSSERLREAIDNGELINYYQPKVSIVTGEVIGVETLVRWLHPEDGLIYPDNFVPVAEVYGLIDDLTRVVITAAIQQTKYFIAAGLNLSTGINVSTDNLDKLDFADFVLAVASEHDVKPQAIILEITESRLIQNITVSLDILTRLRLKRFRLSIDDFGTGHSSLAQLRDMPFDELKIDRSFTHLAYRDDRLKAIFEASLDLATHLHMEVVAEGVEDLNDWNYIRSTSCHIAQGYFIAKPMKGDEMIRWIGGWRERVRNEKLLAES